ncbi:unnamed protein product [Effrenium voratum]|nr:unnamed protein product [Effrenium voratum]
MPWPSTGNPAANKEGFAEYLGRVEKNFAILNQGRSLRMHVYLADGDLDEILEEKEVREAYSASCHDIRQALRGRGYFLGKGQGGFKSRLAKGKGKGNSREENGASFNGRRIRQLKDGTFLVDAQKFVEDRPACCPDLIVEEAINKMMKRAKEKAELTLKVQPLRQMRRGVITGQIRWVDHQATVADALTKVKGSLEALYNCTFKLDQAAEALSRSYERKPSTFRFKLLKSKLFDRSSGRLLRYGFSVSRCEGAQMESEGQKICVRPGSQDKLDTTARHWEVATTVTSAKGQPPYALWILECSVPSESWKEDAEQVNQIMDSFAVGTKEQLDTLDK